MNLLALYKHFFVDQVPNIAWHDRYANISLLLESYRHLLDKTKQKKILNDHAQELIDHYDTAVKDQNNILELLIGDPAGIAGAGQSLLSADNYKHLISKQEFIDSLYSLITEPNIANFKDFAENWCKFNLKGKNINWLRINRVAAACTTNVSVLCDSKKFNQVFNWLQSKCPADFGMAAYSKWISDTYPNYTDLNDNLVNNNTIDWFIRNEFILDRLKQIISAGINTDNKFQYENYQPHLLQLNLSKDTDYDNREFLYERWILKDTRDEQLRRVVYDPYYLSMFLWYLYTYNYSFINNNTVV
ncbi:MAG: hypothetical protein Q4F00_07275 [bacterium]|nr:hypothetical protein [bacterium]